MTVVIGFTRETALLLCAVWALWSLANFLTSALTFLVMNAITDWQHEHQEPLLEVSRHERTPSGGTVTEWRMPAKP